MDEWTVLPATFAQEREFRGSIDRVAWRNLAVGWQVDGEVDAQRIRRVLVELTDRHEILRTCLRELRGEVVQVVAPRLAPPLDVVDLEHLRSAALRTLRRPFDLSEPPLWRAIFVRRAQLLLLVVAHTIWDAYSSIVFARDFVRCCNGAALEPLGVQPGDVAACERTVRDADTERFWTRELSTEPRRLSLPIDRHRAATHHYRGEDLSLPPSSPWVGRALRAAAESEGTTLATALLAAYALLLRADAEQDEIVIGVDDANRDRPGTREVIGYLLDVVPIRVHPRTSFRATVATLRRTLAAAHRHRLPLRRLASLAPAGTTLYEATLNVRPYERGPIAMRPWEPPVAWANFPVASVWWDAHLDLSLDVHPSGAITGELSYNTEAIERELARRLAAEFPRILRRAARYPDRDLA